MRSVPGFCMLLFPWIYEKENYKKQRNQNRNNKPEPTNRITSRVW